MTIRSKQMATWQRMAAWLLLVASLVEGQTRQSTTNGPTPQGEVHPPSPCPGIFQYENERTWNTRWYGVAQVDTRADRPFTLNIVLDRKADLLGTWAGTVTSEDNENFELQHLAPGSNSRVTRISVRFFVNFPRGGPVPRLARLSKDGQRLCGPGQGVTSTGQGTFTLPAPSRPPNRPPSSGGPRPSTHPPAVVTSQSTGAGNHGFSISTVPPATSPTRVTRPNTRPTRFGVTTLAPLPTVSGSSSFRPPPTRPTPRPTAISPSGVNFPGSASGASSSEDCGKIDIRSVPLVVQGQSTSPGEWPWHVAIYAASSGNPVYWCGGTLISKRGILTAAHCVTNKDNGRVFSPDRLIVYLGKHSLPYGWTTSEGVQTFTPERIIRHPTYDGQELKGDLALIMLEQAANMTSRVRRICLWPREETSSRNVEGKDGTVVGWGYDSSNKPTPDLMKTSLRVRTYEECVRSKPEFFSRYLVNKTFCAGFGNGTSACNGDSGGGMVFKHSDDRWYIRGIVSNAVPRRDNPQLCSSVHYNVFVDVAQYRSWIMEKLPELSNNHV